MFRHQGQLYEAPPTADWTTVILHQIEAVRKFDTIGGISVHVGDLGGWVEHEMNLSQDGSCWLDKDSIVCGYASVCDDALLYSATVVGLSGGERKWCGASESTRITGHSSIQYSHIIGKNIRIHDSYMFNSTVKGGCSLDSCSVTNSIVENDVTISIEARVDSVTLIGPAEIPLGVVVNDPLVALLYSY